MVKTGAAAATGAGILTTWPPGSVAAAPPGAMVRVCEAVVRISAGIVVVAGRGAKVKPPSGAGCAGAGLGAWGAGAAGESWFWEGWLG